MDGLDKSLPFAEGMISAEESGKSVEKKGERICLNCGTILFDAFCPHCGQKDIPMRQSLGELLTNFVSSFWSFESKFFKTGYLLFIPGFLTIAYTNGQRERYYHPARMYVFISFVYFLLFTTLPEPNEPATGTTEFNVTNSDDESNALFSIDSVQYKNIAEYDSVQLSRTADERDGWFMQLVRKREIALREKYKTNSSGFKEDFFDSFMANSPKIFFFLLPVFATLLKLLYIRRDFYYSEHLVFSIYYYNFFFLAGSIYMLLNLIPAVDWVATLLGFWIVFYLLFAMKKAYKQGWLKTLLKYGTFLFLFSICVGIGLFINLMFTLMYI